MDTYSFNAIKSLKDQQRGEYVNRYIHLRMRETILGFEYFKAGRSFTYAFPSRS